MNASLTRANDDVKELEKQRSSLDDMITKLKGRFRKSLLIREPGGCNPKKLSAQPIKGQTGIGFFGLHHRPLHNLV